MSGGPKRIIIAKKDKIGRGAGNKSKKNKNERGGKQHTSEIGPKPPRKISGNRS